MSDDGSNSVRTTRGVVAVLARGDRWLMIQRAEGIPLGGAWCFPGGGIHAGETPAEAVVREIREEVNLIITPRESVWRWSNPENGLELEWWTADVVGGSVKPDPAEVQRAEWMTIDAIRNRPNVLPNNIKFIEFAERAGLLPM